MRGRTKPVYTAEAAGGGLTSDPIDLKTTYSLSYDATWTGTLNGSLIAEVSNDDGTTWHTKTTTVLGGAPGTVLTEYDVVAYDQIRFRITAGNAGNMTLNVGSKGS